MSRVQSVDFTAAHMLHEIETLLKERDGHLIFTNLPLNVPTGQDLEAYFSQLELVAPSRSAKVCARGKSSIHRKALSSLVYRIPWRVSLRASHSWPLT